MKMEKEFSKKILYFKLPKPKLGVYKTSVRAYVVVVIVFVV